MKKRFTSLFPTDVVAVVITRFFLLGCLLGLSVAASAQTRFVSTTGTNGNPATATSWATATADLRGAINSLTAGGEVWVAGGTYKPTTGTDRASSFNLKNTVAIYGGFVGTEANRSERPVLNLTTPSSTTLSGDIGTENDPADNSYHVILNSNLTNTAILDGFVITGGNANSNGGGMVNSSSSPNLINCHFISNTASSSGGGIYNFSFSSPSLINCSFISNEAGSDGGGIFEGDNGGSSLTNCIFISNKAGSGGGGISISGSSASLTNCSFTSNTAAQGAGGASINRSSGDLTNCNFTSNSSRLGGGAFLTYSSSSLIHCRFTSNSASSAGGGIYNATANPSLINCSFASNSAPFGGGIANIYNTNPSLINCIFWNNGGNNTFQNYEGATTTSSYSLFEPSVTNYTGSNNLTTTIFPFVSADNLQLTNCSVAVNAGDPASATAVSGPYSVTALPQMDLAGNPRIFGNRVDIGAYEFQAEPLARITVSTLASSASVCTGQAVSLSATVTGGSNLSYSWAAPTGATLGSTTTNPVSATLLTSGPKAFTVTVTNLSTGCTATSSVTVTGTAPTSTTRFVSTTGTNGNPATATSWATATADLRGAINSLTSGGEVWVAGGTYKPTTGTDRDISFSMKNNVAIYGGFVGTETNRSQRPALNLTTPSSTTLSGDIGEVGNIADNSYHVISNSSITSTAILDGFVITKGNANYSTTSDFRSDGGGMLNGNSSPTLTNCHFISNSSIFTGGGMYNSNSNPSLTNCSFASNSASLNGGGVYNSNSSPSLTNCSFTSNSASSGGGVDNSNSSPSLTNCSFSSNFASNSGGGMYNAFSSPTLTNCRFTSNTADAGGGINSNTNCNPLLTNCSFTSNSASSGGGIYTIYSSNSSLINCIFWNNGGNKTIYTFNATTTASYSLFEPEVDSYTGSNNLTTTTSPFVSGSNLQLTNCSVAVNAGDPASATSVSGPYSVTALPQTDFDGNPRIFGNRVDIGAYELQAEPLARITVSTQSSSASVCIGQSVSLSATVTGGSNLSYSWAAPAGATLGSTTTNPVSVTLLTTGPKAFTVTVTNLTSGCTATSSVTVTGNAVPTATITPSSATLTCASPSVSLTASGGTSYLWEDNSTNAIRAITTAGTYSVTVTASGGCSATASRTVTGNISAPTATITPSSATLTCASPTVSLTASGGSTYSWEDNSTNAVRAITTAGTYSVTVTNGNGCSASTSVTVFGNSSAPTATITPSSATLTCASPTVSLTASGGSTYHWEDNSTNAVRPITTAGTYSVTVTAGNGCSASTSVTVFGNSSAPTVLITPSSATLTCASPTVSLTASGGSSYHWDDNSINAIRAITTAGTYSVTVTAGNGCLASTSVTVFGNSSAPTATIIPSSATLTCASPTVSLTASGGSSYRWDDNSTNAIRTVSAAGPYSVTVTNGNGCSASTSITVSNTSNTPSAPNLTSTTITQGAPTVILTASNCAGTLTWNGPGGSSGTGAIAVATTNSGTFVYQATCNVSGCVSESASATVVVMAPTVTGSFDGFIYGADCSSLRGWAWDRNKANTVVSIEILVDAQSHGTILANEFRQDLKDGGKGNGIHAFRWNIPDELKDGEVHTLSATVAGSGFTLKDGPKTIRCQNGTPPPPPNKPPVAPTVTPLTIQEGVNFTTTLPVFTDPENGTLTYALAGMPSGLTFTGGTRQISGKTEIAGSFVLTYSATDDKGATNSVSFNLTVNPAETVVTGSFEGYLDKLDCGGIRGWVWDRNKPNTPVTVEFYLESSPGNITVLGSIIANSYRVDLKDAGKGNGVHAYNFTPPGSVTNGTRVLARVQGSTFVLKGSPKEYQCNAPTRLSAETTEDLQVTVLGNPVSNQVEVEIRGAEGKPLNVQVTDINGHLISEQQVKQSGVVEHHRLPVSEQTSGVLVLRVSTPTQHKTVRILKGK